MTLIYQAGPMSGYADFNYPAFHHAAVRMRAAGHEVINPAENHDGRQDLEWVTYLETALAQVAEAEEVHVLPGWTESAGARLEVALAKALGKPVKGPHFWMLQGEKDPSVQAAGKPDASPQVDDAPNPVVDYTFADETILQEAQRLVHGDRQEAYGHPIEDFSRTARIWSAILDTEVRPQDVALCMVGVKISREVNRPKRDNRVDAAGYMETLSMVEDELARRHHEEAVERLRE